MDVVGDDHDVKLVGSLEGIIEASDSTVVNGNSQLDFLSGLACSSSNSPKKVDQFVVGRGAVNIIIERTGSIMEQRREKAIPNFHGEDDDWIFCRIKKLPMI